MTAREPLVADALLEREVELEALATALERARAGSGRLTVVEGHAGIGKSQLLAAAGGIAESTGMRTLSATGDELERDFAFGVALQLLEPAIAGAGEAERDRLLAGAAALTAPLFEGAGPAPQDGDSDDDVFPVLHGLYWLVSNLAENGPLLIAVDDAHWADAPSLRFLLYLAQRLAALPVALVVTRRSGEPGGEEELLARLTGHASAAHIALEALGERSVSRMVEAACGAADPELSAACAEVTGGNPLLVNQLLAALQADGGAPGPEAARQVRELGPEEVSRWVLLRLSALQLGATSLARAVAVLGDGAPRRRAAELARLEPGAAGDAADALAAADILRPGEPLSFVHPIVRSAIYAELPAAERARAHLDAARALREEDPAPELVAGHLLKAEPRGEAWVVEVLQAAADRALGAGAPRSAVRYLRRALEEPPGRDVRPEALAALGRAAAMAGDPRAVEHLEEALMAAGEPLRRAEIAYTIGRALGAAGRHREAAEIFDRGLEELEATGAESALSAAAGRDDPDAELMLRLEAGYVGAARRDVATLPLAVARLRPILAGTLDGATPGQRALLAHVAYERALLGEPHERVLAAARAALGGQRLLEEDTADGVAFHQAVAALAWADDIEGALDALAAAVTDARRRGTAFGYANAAHARAAVHLLAGNVEEAHTDARVAMAAGREGWRLALPAAHAVACRALL
ncbi:MAG TPA: AAA family ATPase, partial [Solirubrobacteraceae bacterium]|nr:AAA family ATPase [Solirubrobacteraceae bacterium]